jgi:hypothetical protein
MYKREKFTRGDGSVFIPLAPMRPLDSCGVECEAEMSDRVQVHSFARARQNNLFGRLKPINRFVNATPQVAVSGTFHAMYSAPNISEQMLDGGYGDFSTHIMAKASGGPRYPSLKSRVQYF